MKQILKMDQIKIEDLVKDGWKDCNERYAGCLILERERERMIYDNAKQRVITTYRI